MTEATTDLALRALDAEITRLTTALEMIAGNRPCPDNLLGNADLAKAALEKRWPFHEPLTSAMRAP